MNSNPFDLSGQTALVAGGSKGLGLEMGLALLEAGANLLIGARTEKEVQQLAADLDNRYQPRVMGARLDVTDPGSAAAFVEQAMAEFGRVDVLVNSAGINIRENIAQISDAHWRQLQSVNVDGVFHMCRAVSPVMVEAGYGRIINIGSALSLVGLEGRVNYCASKGAVLQLTKALALELAGSGVTANTICPGPFATELNAPIIGTPAGDKLIQDHIPLGRWGELHEIRPAVLFLASPSSSFVTGSCVSVDGGWTAF